MSTYIKLSTLEYPRHIGDIQLDKAGESDYALVEYTEPPVIDTAKQRIYEIPPVNNNGAWSMVWAVRDATPEEIEIANNQVDSITRNLV